MPFRLVAVDVDGTLLRRDGTISERTRRALATAIERGAALAVATGRRRRTALPITRQLDLPHFLVASQGAVTWDGDEIVAHAHLPGQSARRALEIIGGLGMSAVMFANAAQPEAIWFAGDWRANQRLVAYAARDPELAREVVDTPTLDEALAHDPIQLIVFDSMERLEGLNEALTGHAPPPASLDPPAQDARLWRVIFSRDQFVSGGAIEVVGPGTSKAAALQGLCERIGCMAADVIAFGDQVNDLEMLAFAGLGVCMANGTAEAKAAADRVCPSNEEDGIAAALEDVGLA
ncbi:MAG TPA: HAD family hydrolase [Chloroflexota bacterium]|nr:HAD family hydrolase [Chloroflexota bacterium]